MKNSGKRKHWSQHALAGAGAALGIGRRGRKRVRTAIRRVARKFRTRRPVKRGLKRKRTDVIGSFVKCKDWKTKKFGKVSKAHEKFSKKVNGVIYSELPRNTSLYSYAFRVNGSPANQSNQLVKWFQICLDPLQARDTAKNFANGQLAADGQMASSNPAGIFPLFEQETAYGSLTGVCYGPTVMSATWDKSGVGINVQPHRELQWRQAASTLVVQLKNIKSYGVTLEIMLVKAKKRISRMANDLGQTYKTDNNTPQGTVFPTGWDNTSPNDMTPLELGQMGLARAGNNFLWSNPLLSLNDSTDFNEHYTVTHKCKAYVPGGGVIEKSIRHGSSRTLKNAHVAGHLYDGRTTFMVFRYIPEVQLLANTLDTAILGPGVPVGVTENASLTDMVGTVYYRMGFKQIFANQPYGLTDQQNRQITSHNVVANLPVTTHGKTL